MDMTETHAMPVTGHIILWSMHTPQIENRLLHTAFRDTPWAHLVPPMPTPDKAFRKALYAWKRARREAVRAQQGPRSRTAVQGGRAAGELVVKIDHSRTKGTKTQSAAETVVYGLVMRETDADDLALTYSTDLRFALSLPSGDLHISTAARGDIIGDASTEAMQVATEIAPLYAACLGMSSGTDIGKLLRLAVTTMRGVTLNSSAAFMPHLPDHDLADFLLRIRSIPCQEGEIHIDSIPQVDTGALANDIGQRVTRSLAEEIQAAEASFRDLITKTQRPSPDALSARLMTFADIQERVLLHTKLLHLQTTHLDTHLEQLRIQARTAISTPFNPDESNDTDTDTEYGYATGTGDTAADLEAYA